MALTLLFMTEYHALQIILYYDEFELYNPLGASAKSPYNRYYNTIIGNLVCGKHGECSTFRSAGVLYY